MDEDNEYILNEIKQKRLPAPRFGHAATRCILSFFLYRFCFNSHYILDTMEDFLCMVAN